jgi:hypothetical protein
MNRALARDRGPFHPLVQQRKDIFWASGCINVESTSERAGVAPCIDASHRMFVARSLASACSVPTTEESQSTCLKVLLSCSNQQLSL